MTRHKRYRYIQPSTIVLGLLALVSPSSAADSSPDATPPPKAVAGETVGIITGRVLNSATRSYLNSAEVRDEVGGQTAYTNSDGYFSIGLAAGTHTLIVTYAGLDSKGVPIEVKGGKSDLGEIALTSAEYDTVLLLDQVVVSGAKEGRSASFTRQKNAENSVSVVSADEFPNVTSGNIGDFLQNLPGISIDYSDADPRAVRVRGMDPNMASVSVDGMRSANAASGSMNRQFQFDQISLQNVEAIEITKAPTPANDADQGGGNINMVSKSAFKTKGRRISYGLSENLMSNNLTLASSPYHQILGGVMVRPGGNFNFTQSFKERLGVNFNVNWFENLAINQRVENDYNDTDKATSGQVSVLDSQGAYIYKYTSSVNLAYTSRQSMALNLDLRLTDNTTLWAKAQVNKSMILSGGQGLILNSYNLAQVNTATLSDTHVDVTATSKSYANAYNSANNKKYGVGTNFSLGADQKFDLWTLNYAFAESQSTNQYKASGIPTNITMSLAPLYSLDSQAGSPYTLITQSSTSSIYDFSKYYIAGKAQFTDDKGLVGMDRFYTAKADARRDFVTVPFLKYVKTGVSFREQYRASAAAGRRRWNAVNSAGTVANITPSSSIEGFYPNNYLGTNNLQAVVPSIELAQAYFLNNPGQFVEDVAYRAGQDISTRQQIFEKIHSWYGMGGAQFGKFNLLAGVRYEHTADIGQGYRTGTADSTITDTYAKEASKYKMVYSKKNFGNWFPNVQGRYNFTPSLVARASFTKSIARQDFSNIVPNTTSEDTTTKILKANNPDLAPVLYTNYDASLEYFLKPVGVLSVGYFRKDLKNYTRTLQTAIESGSTWYDLYPDNWTLESKQNIGDAKVSGFELSYSQQLSAYASFLKGFGFFANYTQLKSEGSSAFGGTAVRTDTKAPLENFVPITYNTGLNYQNSRFRASLKYNFKGQYLTGTATSTNTSNSSLTLTDYTYYRSRGTADVYVSYNIYKTHAFFLDIKNIANAPLVKFENKSSRISYYQISGAQINVGISGTF